MQRSKAWPIVLSLVMLFVMPTQATAQVAGFTVDAKAAVLMEATSGQILFEQNATTRIAPASLTKIIKQ